MTKVIIHGELGLKYGKEHNFKLNKLSEIASAMEANYPGFRHHLMMNLKKGLDYNMIDLDNKNKNYQNAEEFLKEKAPKEIHIVPCIAGSGLIAAAIGAVVSFVSAAATIVAGLAGAIGGFLGSGSFLANLAIGLIIQGVMSLLFPVELPKEQKPESKIDTSSYIFTSLDNNAIQGFPIPLLYGELRVGSNIIGTSVFNEDLG